MAGQWLLFFAFYLVICVILFTFIRPMPTVRDLLAWVEFMHTLASSLRTDEQHLVYSHFMACIHGACFIFLDSLEDRFDGDEVTKHLFVDSGSATPSSLVLKHTQGNEYEHLKCKCDLADIFLWA